MSKILLKLAKRKWQVKMHMPNIILKKKAIFFAARG
jgi:hypothetical protein